MQYEYEKTIDLGGGILTRVDNFFSKKTSSGLMRKDEKTKTTIIQYYVRDHLQSFESKEDFTITLEITGGSHVQKTIIEVPSADNLNEYHLKSYITGLYVDLLLGERSSQTERFVVRVYAKYLNSRRIKGELLINADLKTLIKSPPSPAPDKHEPLTEHVIYYDAEVDAINIDHARSLAYNNARNLNAALSLLLDIDFELVNSEFKNFIIKDENKLSISRYRTGFLDPELGLVVKDNLNGLKSLKDQNDLDSFFSGSVFFEVMEPQDETGRKTHHFNVTKKQGVEDAFRSHALNRDKTQKALYCDGIKKDVHFPNEEILIPTCIRDYFNGIKKLSSEKREAFMGCARMYNVSILLSKSEPTAAAAYLVCALEVIAKYEKMHFSPWIEKMCGADYDKDLIAYFYGSVRSGHFHSGRFVFHENSTSLLTAIDTEFQDKFEAYYRFYGIARQCLVSWIEEEVLTTAP